MRVTGWRRGLGTLLFAFLLSISVGTRACADTVSSTDSPIIYIVGPYAGNVTIHTWDRPSVQIDGDTTVQYKHFPAELVARRYGDRPPAQMLWAQTIDTPSGQLALAPEAFSLEPLSPSPHDAVLVRGSGDATLTIPSGTALIIANLRTGELAIQNYHGGQFFARVMAGGVRLNDVQGTGAIQVNNGPIVAVNSSFDRLRVRTGRGNMFFENCASAQIQASSLTGTIIYDNGTFTPGLAHFESQRGSVALGVSNGNAQITAHSDSGRVFNEAQGFARGGPVVTATSVSGAVMYYRGSLRQHPQLMQRLPANARPFRKPPGGRRPPGRIR